MESVKLNYRVGSDEMLHLKLPVKSDTELEVVVIYQPVNKKRDWSPGFFENTFGKWEGEDLVREPQGAYQEREPFL